MNVVVTGGAGFIGAHLAGRLSEDGFAVTCLDDLSTGHRENLTGLGVRFVEGSILDAACLEDACSQADAIVHLAARPSVARSIEDPLRSNDVNVNGTLNVLEQARRTGAHVVMASSSSVYGANSALPKHEGLVPRPVSPYAVSKLAAESYTLSYQRVFAVPALVFRFFNVYGPLQSAGHAYAAVVPTFINAALRGEALPVNGDGTQSRDFTYVGSVVALIADALVRRVTDEAPVNLAFGSRTSLLELIGVLEDVLGRRLERTHLPPRPGDVPHSQADQTKLRSLFPGVGHVPLRAGLEATIAWFRQQHCGVPGS